MSTQQEADAAVGIHADLGWALTTVLRAYGRAADCAVADLPGGSRGFRLLSATAHDCPRSQLALAQHVGLDRTVVTYLVDDFVAAALVTRQADPVDRRTWRVVVTDIGRCRLEQLEARLRRVEDEVLRPLGRQDSAQLRALLRRVAVSTAGGEPVATSCGDVTRLSGPGPA